LLKINESIILDHRRLRAKLSAPTQHYYFCISQRTKAAPAKQAEGAGGRPGHSPNLPSLFAETPIPGGCRSGLGPVIMDMLNAWDLHHFQLGKASLPRFPAFNRRARDAE